MSENTISVYKNKDKDGWQENWYQGRNWLNFPFPCRIIISANPGSGKTNMIKNILAKAKPYYQRIFLCHYDIDTSEYDDVKVIKLREIPPAKSEFFESKYKSCLIIDDHEFEYMTKEQRQNLDRLWGYTSTHLGLTCICATQNFFNLPAFLRRMSDVFFIWKGSTDLDSLYAIGRKLGLNKEEFKSIMNRCKGKFDNICFDLTNNSPCRVRLNVYQCVSSTDQVE